MHARFSILSFLLAALVLSMVSGCGGGDGDSSSGQSEPPPATTNGNWDQLIWDQDRWN